MARELSAHAFLNPQSVVRPLRLGSAHCEGGWSDADATQYYLDNEAMTNEGGNMADVASPVILTARWSARRIRRA